MYKVRNVTLLFFIVLISMSLIAQDNPKWELDLDEPIEFYEFINNDKFLFITSGEYVWCYNSDTGQEVWKMEVDDFEKEGISILIGELYLTNSDNKLQAYDAVSGKMLWENEYDGISQSDFEDLFFAMNYAMFDFGDDIVGIDLNTGKELYRNEITFWGELVNLGTYNYDVLDKQKKILILEDSEIASLYDLTNGTKLYSDEDYDINEDLIKNGLKWSYEDTDENSYLFVLEDGAILLDLNNNKIAASVKFSIDGEKNVIIPTALGAAVMGEEKMVHFNFITHEVAEIAFPFDDVRTLTSVEVGGKDVLIVSLGDQMAAIDISEGKILWKTNDEDPMFEGYVHKYIERVGDNILVAYNRPLIMSSDNGTYIYLMSINVLTGEVKYKTPVLLSEVAMSDFTRGLTKAITGAFSAAMTVASAGMTAGSALNAYDAVNDLMGYSNIGFTYNYFDYDGDIIFESRVKEPMMNPQTRDEPGEGYVRVNKETGEIIYSTYFALCEGLMEIDQLAPIAYFDNYSFLAGEDKLVAFDFNTGKVLWTLGEEVGFVTDLNYVNGVLYTKFGRENYNIALVEDDVEVKETFSEDPFGFMAIDVSSGKILWKVNTEVDPSLQTPDFSLSNYFDPNSNRLYFADDYGVYALKLGADGGNYDWQYKFEENSLGEMEYEETYAIQERWIGSVPRTRSTTTYMGGGWSLTTTTTSGGIDAEEASKFIESTSEADLTSTYTSWGNIYGVSAKKCLQVLYGVDQLLAIAPEGFALLNAADGSEIWKTAWDYSNDEVSYVPKILGNSIVYCLDEELVSMDLSNGSKQWSAEESEKAKYFLAPNEKYIYTINDEMIRGYSIK